jgi:osmoprotectant transport system permease protein
MRTVALLVTLLLPATVFASSLPTVRVGSKSFTESYILAEITAQIVDATGEARADRQVGLGGTGVTYRALEHGEIDLYPEYTGTLARVILKDASLRTVDAIRAALTARGLTVSDALGFSNTYALAVRREMAHRLGLATISDLTRHRELRAAFTSGFLERDDGWPGLRRHYGLTLAEARTIEHALAYGALAGGKVDLIDVFSTDGQLARLDLSILRDDRGFFPDYSAVLLARQSFLERFPRTWRALQTRLVGRIDDALMARLNARVELDRKTFGEVAAEFLGAPNPERRGAIAREILSLTLDHLSLVALSVVVATAVGLPLALLAARFRRLAQLELMSVGILQTIPALALLCFMIPLFGIGKWPALVALFLYALLPIVRSAYTGIISLDHQLLEIAGVLGLNRWQRLLRIELPLASIHIMGGIKTAAVLTVGTATLAAFVGGGGYGTLIVRGLALDDVSTILAGALPAALMALAIHGGFELLDRVVVPYGLRRDLSRSV